MLADGGFNKAHGLARGIVYVDEGLSHALFASCKILKIINNTFYPQRAFLHFVEHHGQFATHAFIGNAAQCKRSFALTQFIKHARHIGQHSAKNWNIKKNQAIGIVNLMGNTRHKYAQCRHFIGLHQLALVARKFIKRHAQRAGALRHLLAQNMRPQHYATKHYQQGHDNRPGVKGHGFPPNFPGFQHAQPFVVDSLIAPGFPQDGQSFAQPGHEHFIALERRVPIAHRGHRTDHNVKIVQFVLPDNVVAWQNSHHGIFALA